MTVVDKGISYIKHIVDYDDGGSSDSDSSSVSVCMAFDDSC